MVPDYFELLSHVVQTVQASTGPGRALEAFKLADPHAPPGGISDYDSRVRLGAFLEGQRAAPEKELRNATMRALRNAYDFLDRRRRERLRQARITFNTAVSLVLLGTLIILAGVVLLFVERTTAGVLSAAVGAVSNITSALLFKLNRDANDRLDKITVELGRLEGIRRTLEQVDQEARES